MKKILIYTIVGSLAASISGAITYSLQTSQEESNNIAQESSNTSGSNVASSASSGEITISDFTSTDDTPTSGFGKVVSNLMKGRNISIPALNLSLGADNIGTIKLAITGANAAFNTETNDYKFGADVRVTYGSNIDAAVSFYYDNNSYAYFTYLGKKYRFQAPNAITNIVNLLPKMGIATPTLPDTSSLDLNGLLGTLKNSIATMTETKISSGYEYRLNFGTLDLSSYKVADFKLSGMDFALLADSAYNLTNVATYDPNAPIKVESTKEGGQSLEVGLNASLAITPEQTYTGLADEVKATYVNADGVVSSVDSLASTIAQIANKKNFNSTMDFTLTTPANQNILAKAVLKGDMTGIDKDVAAGQYELSFDETAVNNNASKAYVRYKDKTTYLQFNDVFKGKITNSSVKDIFNIISDHTTDQTTKDMTEKVNTVMKVFKGESKDYKTVIEMIPANMIYSLDYVEGADHFSIVFDGKALGLGSYENYYVTLSVYSDSSNNFQYFKMEGLKFDIDKKTYTFGAKISLGVEDAFTGFDSSVDLTTFKDYAGAVNIFSTVGQIADAKKFSSTYSMNVTTPTSHKIVADGVIAGDFANFKKDDANVFNSDFGNYRLSVNSSDTEDIKDNSGTVTGQKVYNHNLDVVYQDSDIYFIYDSFFKNSLKLASVGKIYDLINSKTDVSSGMVEKMNTFLDTLKKTDFYTDLLNGDFSQLNGMISTDIDTDVSSNSVLTIVIDPAKVLKGTILEGKVSGATIKFDTSSSALTSVQVSGLNLDDFQLDFTWTLDAAYKDFTLADTAKAQYVGADGLADSFVNLPNQMAKFNIGLDASLINDTTDQEGNKTSKTTKFNGFANVDRTTATDPAAIGALHVTESDNTTHNIEFDYSTVTSADGKTKDGKTIAQYNVTGYSDTMHIIMHNSSVFDIVDQVKTMDDTNLLKKYVNGLNTTVSSLPIMDAIHNKDYTSLLNGYIKDASITADTVTLKVSPALFDSTVSVDSTETYDIIIKYDASTDTLTSAYLKASYKGYTISATISLAAYGNTASPTDITKYDDSTKSQFIDMDNLPLFIKMGIHTTEKRYFSIKATFAMKIRGSLFQSELDELSTYATAKVKVNDDGKTQAYLSLNNTPTKSITDKGFYCTEFFIDEDMAYVCQTRNTSGGNKYYSTNFKLTRAEILKNIVYYVVDYSLNLTGINFGDIAAGSIYDAMASNNSSSSTATISKNYAGYINSAVYSSTSKEYSLNMNLANIVSVSGLDFYNAEVDIYHDDNSNLSRLVLQGKGTNSAILSAYGLINVTANLDARHETSVQEFTTDSNGNKVDAMQRYYDYIAAFNGSYGSLGYYEVTSITVKKTLLFKIVTGRTVNDNGNKFTKNYGAEAIWFYN